MMVDGKDKANSDVTMIDTTTSAAAGHGSPSKTGSKHQPKTEEEVKRSHCTHGPNGKCINCLGVTKETAKEITYKCKHGPNEKCANC
jgi:hypothetical protein